MNDRKKGKYIGVIGAIIVHCAVIALLILMSFIIPERMEESGVEVMLGNVQSAYGGFNPASLVDVEVVPQETSKNQPSPSAEQELITQADEETIAIKPETKPREKEVKPPEKTAEEKAAEAKKLAEEQAERERKAANQRVAGAFGRGAQMGSSGTTEGQGTEGSPTGSSATGAATGSGGYGTFDLGGRSLGEGGLPRPAYNVQDEGRVVITITVNPGGHVIATGIHKNTNTVNTSLRKAAEEAAKKAKFNVVEGVNNQTGTITYYFNLK